MNESIELADDLLRGIKEIAEHFGRGTRTVQHFLDNDLIPNAFKIGGVWHLRRSTTRAWIEDLERQAAQERTVPQQCVKNEFKKRWLTAGGCLPVKKPGAGAASDDAAASAGRVVAGQPLRAGNPAQPAASDDSAPAGTGG